MGKTKTAFVGDTAESKKPSYDKAAKAAKRQAKAESQKIHLSGLKGGQRVKVVEAEIPAAEETTSQPTTSDKTAESKKAKTVKARGKKYQSLKDKINRHHLYPLPEAINLVKEVSYSKFDGTVELTIVVKKAGLATQVTLPFTTGKTKKVEIASDATLEALKTGKITFDLLLATSEMMPKLIPFAKLLGPKGLMPNPKNGTIIKSAKEADKFKGNTISLKTEKEAPIIHTLAGKVSQKETELEANIKTILDGIGKAQLVKAFLKPTMGPSVKLAL